MASIERTAWPRFSSGRTLREQELEQFYSLTPKEKRHLDTNVRGNVMRLCFAVQLKAFQRLGYFPAFNKVPVVIIEHVKKCLGLHETKLMPVYDHDRTKRRHEDSICTFLKVKRWRKNNRPLPGEPSHPGRRLAIGIAWRAAQTMNNPADIINVVMEELVRNHHELPSFSQIDQLVRRVRASVNRKIFSLVYQKLPTDFMKKIDSLFVMMPGFSKTGYNNLKRLPKSPTITHFRELISHHDWLLSLGSTEEYLDGISKIKLRQFFAEAKSLDASDYSSMNPQRRAALLVCLIHYAQKKSKDALAIMFCRTMTKIHKKAEEKYAILRDQREEMAGDLVEAFYDVLTVWQEGKPQRLTSKNIAKTLFHHGGAEALHQTCAGVIAGNSDSHFPLLWDYFAPKRKTLIKLIRILNFQTASQDNSLINALDVVLSRAAKHDEFFESSELDLSFASRQWDKLILGKRKSNKISWRYFELAVFSCLSDELRSGDIFIEGSENHSDYRKELIDWKACQPLLAEYCSEVGLPQNAKDFIENIRVNFTKIATDVDAEYPEQSYLEIDSKGNPVLRKRPAKQRSRQAIWLSQEIRSRISERNLLDILCNSHHYTEWAQVFGPITGFDAKILEPAERYILTNFAYGTRMGPTQAERHIKADTSAHMMSWINRRHVSPQLLDKAVAKLVDFSSSFQILKAWGTGKSCAADGTICYIREENLIAEFHLRYGHRGGIAYHHVSDQYVALFSTFIPCGVWEAVEIIEGLLKNRSKIKPDTVHADTQGQSAVVFALAYLFGIKLMPRIRNWKELKFFRPDRKARYQHIDGLFSDTVNWKLIEKHWPDLMQVALSIRAGKVSSSMLLRKLTTYSRKNRLYQAFQALGHVIRTQFLLEYISNVELRETITATTNKVEQYNQLCDWASFGAMELVASNDEDEMEKAVKYNDVITNSVILQNIVDMSDIIHQLTREGAQIREDDIASLSPYLTGHIKRFGDYHIDLKQVPSKIEGDIRELGFVHWR